MSISATPHGPKSCQCAPECFTLAVCHLNSKFFDTKKVERWNLSSGDLKVQICLLRFICSARRRLKWKLGLPLLQVLLHVSPQSHWSATESWGLNTLVTDSSLETLILTWQQAATTDVVKVGACHLEGVVLWNLLAVCYHDEWLRVLQLSGLLIKLEWLTDNQFVLT